MSGEPRAYRYVIAGVLFLFLLLSDWVVLNGPLLAVRRGLLVALALAAVPHLLRHRRAVVRAVLASPLVFFAAFLAAGLALSPFALAPAQRSRSHPGLRRGDALRGRGRPDGVAPGDAGPVAAGARAQARRVAAARSRRPVGGSSHHGSGRWNARGAARLRRPVRQPQPARRGGRRLPAARRLPRHRATPAVACGDPGAARGGLVRPHGSGLGLPVVAEPLPQRLGRPDARQLAARLYSPCGAPSDVRHRSDSVPCCSAAPRLPLSSRRSRSSSGSTRNGASSGPAGPLPTISGSRSPRERSSTRPSALSSSASP